MFSFGRRNNSIDVQRRILRLCNLTVPQLKDEYESARRHRRTNRSLPAVVAPWDGKKPDVSRCVMVMTKDFGDEGVSLISTHPITAREVVFGVWLPDPVNECPWFFLGELRHATALGGGFWSLGVALTEFAETRHGDALTPLLPFALKLCPPAACVQ